jgi:hypothetical protein
MSRRVVLNRPLHIYETGSTIDISQGVSTQVITTNAEFLELNEKIARSEALLEQEVKFSVAIDNAAVSASGDLSTSGDLGQTGKDPATRQVQELLQVEVICTQYSLNKLAVLKLIVSPPSAPRTKRIKHSCSAIPSL